MPAAATTPARVPNRMSPRHSAAFPRPLAPLLTFHVGGQRLPAAAGSFVFLPRDVPHTFTVEARVLQLASPPGLEAFFLDWGDRPLDVEAMAQALAPYGVEFVGPPPGDSR